MQLNKKHTQYNKLLLFGVPFFATVLVLGFVYALNGLFPFGNDTVAWADMVQQALPFMMQFKQILASNDGLFFTTGNAGGMNFWGVLLYFIASPFTLLSAFVPLEYFHHFANILLVLKMGLAACAATWFFSRLEKPFQCTHGSAGALGVLYAFSGYALMYYQNIVWLDQLILFPLLFIALFYMKDTGNIIPYTVLLAAIIFTHFQIAVMVILAVLLAGGVYVLFFAGGKKGGYFSLRLGIGSIVAVLLTTFVWLPAFIQYGKSPRGISIASSLKNSSRTPHLYTTLPMLLCTAAIFGAIIVIMARGLLANAKVRGVLACFVLFSIPLFVEPINLIWHGGSYQAFPSRFGFIPVFFGLWLCAAALQASNEIPSKSKNQNAGLFVSLLGIFSTLYLAILWYVLAYKREEADFYVRSLWGNKDTLKWGALTALAGAVVFGLCIYMYSQRIAVKRVLNVLLFAIVGISVFYNSMLYIGSAARSTTSFQYAMDLAGHPPDGGGRVRQSRKYTDANHFGAMGYSALSHYSSLTREDYMTAIKKLGYSGYWMEVTGPGGTLLSDAFLNVDGVMAQTDTIDPFYQMERVVYQNSRYAIVNIPYNTEYGMVVHGEPEDFASLPDTDRFSIQNWLYQKIYGVQQPLFVRYEPGLIEDVELGYFPETGEYSAMLAGSTVGQLRYSIDVGQRQELYFDCFRYNTTNLREQINNSFEVRVNGVLVEQNYPTPSNNGFLYLGSFENQIVDIQIYVLQDVMMRSFGVAGFYEADLSNAINNSTQIPVKNVASSFAAEVNNAQEGDLLLLSIAYDEGFTATVNGKSAPIFRVADTFMAVKLQQGVNSIELRFVPQGFTLGLVVSMCFFAGLAGYFFCCVTKQRSKAKGNLPNQYREPPSEKMEQTMHKMENISYIFLIGTAIAAFVGVYVLPLVVRVILLMKK